MQARSTHFCTSKAKAAQALIKELDGPNAAARVAAARTVLEESQQSPAGNGMPQIPGFAILIADARGKSVPVGRCSTRSPINPHRQTNRRSAFTRRCIPVDPTERISQCANYPRSRP